MSLCVESSEASRTWLSSLEQGGPYIPVSHAPLAARDFWRLRTPVRGDRDGRLDAVSSQVGPLLRESYALSAGTRSPTCVRDLDDRLYDCLRHSVC